MLTKAHHRASLTEEDDARRRQSPSPPWRFALATPPLGVRMLFHSPRSPMGVHPLPPFSGVPNFQTNPPRCANSAHLHTPRAPRRTITTRTAKTEAKCHPVSPATTRHNPPKSAVRVKSTERSHLPFWQSQLLRIIPAAPGAPSAFSHVEFPHTQNKPTNPHSRDAIEDFVTCRAKQTHRHHIAAPYAASHNAAPRRRGNPINPQIPSPRANPAMPR